MLALSLRDLTEKLDSRARALRARRWLYAARPFPDVLPGTVPGIQGAAWQALCALAPLPPWLLRARHDAGDGTLRYLLELAGASVETVLIPGAGRSTVCVSSQSGCTRQCGFCATARLGFTRQLDAAEIVLQYALAQADAAPDAPARNVVFMGMGEPMDNLDAVMPAIDRLLEGPAPALAADHITVSTSGVLPGMLRFLREGRGQLALSLNATSDALRERLMPHNRVWPIAALLEALRSDQARTPRRRYFIEYVLWQGVNDSPADARRLVALLRGLRAHVNLIPHNPHPGSPLAAAPPAALAAFQAELASARIRCLVRRPRGQQIAATCGQLAAAPA